MIDIASENLIPVLDVRRFVPVSIPTLRRWTASGKLEVVRAGIKVFTSREAIQRLLRQGPQPAQAPTPSPTKATLARQTVQREAAKRLAARFQQYRN